MILTGPSRKRQRGFSLVELLLTLVLILCLAAASVFSYTALHRSANLDEGLDRLESLIRFAQAEAATTGCKVRLQFEPVEGAAIEEGQKELRSIRVTWEPDFLNSPGVFQAYTNKAWSEDIVNEIVGVASVRPIGPPAPQMAASTIPAVEPLTTEASAEAEFEPEFPGITFYPDGSCDSAELILASRNPEDERRVEVRLSGILGSVSSRMVSAASADGLAEEYLEEEYLDEAAAGDYFQDDFTDETSTAYSPAEASYMDDAAYSSDLPPDFLP